MRTILATLALTALAATAAEARPSMSQPAPMRQAGTLTCTMDPSLGLILGSSRAASCSFVSNYGGFSQSYGGRFDRVGFDVGLTSAQTITWRVYSPNGRSRSNMLNGLYAGPSSEATVFVGAGTQVLFNDQGERVMIEPMTQSGQAGFGIAFGQSGLSLSASSYAVLR